MSPSNLALLLSDRSPQQFGQKHTQMCCHLVNLEGELVLRGDAALTALPRGCWWTQASWEKLLRLSSAERQCTQGLPVSKAKHYFWSSHLGRAAKILHNNNKHFRFAHCFSSEHFMDVCVLGFTSSVGKAGVAIQRQEKRDAGHSNFWPNL